MRRSKLSFLFARRYLSSRKSLSVINIISRVSIFAVGIPVAAMVILLSVLNGFEGLVKSMYTSFDPDIVVVPARGKVFDTETTDRVGLQGMDGVEAVSYFLEESVLLEYRGRQTLATLRGVDDRYNSVVPIEDLLVNGEYELRFGDMEQAVAGQGVAYNLGIRTSFYNPLNVYVPRRGEFSSLLPLDGYASDKLFPAGVFALDVDTDGTYVLSTIGFAQGLLDYEGKASAAAVKVTEGRSVDNVAKALSRELGSDFRALTRYEQKSSMYNIMKYEKWGIFFVSLLVLIIASFSIVGSLVMLIIDKRPDLRTLNTLGADVGFTRRIFVDEGMLIGVLGTMFGVVLGMFLCWLQIRFGFVKLGGQTFIVDAYPVVMRWQDICIIIAATLVVTWIITKFTVSKMIPKSSVRL